MAVSAPVTEVARMLECFLSPDKDTRTQAEEAFNRLKESASDDLTITLLDILQSHSEATVRQQAAVAVRSLLQGLQLHKPGNFWSRLSPSTQQRLQTQLLTLLASETNKTVRRAVGDVVALLAMELTATDEWTDLPANLMQLVQSGNPPVQAAGLRIFAELVPLLGEIIRKNKPGLMAVLNELAQSSDAEVRIETLSMIAALVQHEPLSTWRDVQKTAVHFAQAMTTLIANNDDDAVNEMLVKFVDIAENNSNYFKPQISAVFQALFAIARNTNNEDEVRQMAVEVLLCIAEDKPKMCMKEAGFLREMIETLLEFMLSVQDDPEWLDRESATPIGGDLDENDEENVTRNYDVGENGLDRIAAALGGENVMDVIFSFVAVYLQRPEWQYQLAAIMAISQTVEYLPEDSIDTHLEEIIPALLTHLQPQNTPTHHRIRFVACQALGQIALDHRPFVQQNYSEKIVPALLATLDDAVQRVRGHAISALVNFIEEMDAADLQPYQDALMEKLLLRLSAADSSRVVREQCVTCMACIAGVIEAEFKKYYSVIMPILSKIITAETNKEELELKGKAIECVSIVALSVGNDTFKADAPPVMEALIACQSEILPKAENSPDFDLVKDYLLEALARMCRALKTDFVPYLPRLLPYIFNKLAFQPETVSAEAASSADDMTLVSVANDVYAGLKTSHIQEILQCSDMLCTFIEVLQSSFKEYLQPAASVLLPLLAFQFSDDVKKSALDALAELLAAARLTIDQVGAGQTNGAELNMVRAWLVEIITKVFADLSPEKPDGEMDMYVGGDVDMMVAETGGLAKCVKNAGANVLDGPQVGLLCQKVFQLMQESAQRRAEIATRKNEPDFDEEDVDRLEEEESAEQTLRGSLLEIVGAIMAFHPKEFMESSADLCKKFIEMHLHPNCVADDRALALYICDDVLEHLKDAGAPLWPVFIERLCAAVADAAPAVRQAAAYGIIHAAKIPSLPDAALQNAANLLSRVISESATSNKKKIPHHEQMAIDNAVAALGSILINRSTVLRDQDQGTMLDLWINSLPLKADAEEGARVHAEFVNLLLTNSTLLVGPDSVRLPKILSVCAAIYKTEFTTIATDANLRTFLKSLSAEAIAALAPNFDKKTRKGLERIHRDVANDKN